MSQRLVLASAISALLLMAATISYAQTHRVAPMNVVGVQLDLPSLSDRIGQLEKKNSQLAGQVSQLQQQLAQSKESDGKNFFADRFRITAIEANQKLGGTTSELDKKLSAVASQVDKVDSRVGALSTKFATHTHTYGKTTFGWYSQQMHDLKMAQPTPTSGPN
jgi:TolA-binding protein